MPKLSIITVCRNSQATLAHCIESVAAQEQDTEHILVDGASTDDTHEIIALHREKLSSVISEVDSGIYDALNKGIRLARGDVIGLLHADDYYPSSDVLASVLAAFEDPDIEACYGDLKYVKPDDTTKTVRYWKAGNFDPQKFYHGWMPPHPTFFVRRSIYEKHGLFKLELGSTVDYELMLRFLLKHRIRAAYVPQVLVHMRTGGTSNASLANRLKANRMDRLAWTANGLRPYPWTLLAKPIRKLGQWLVR